jgi:hypothetical protein
MVDQKPLQLLDVEDLLSAVVAYVDELRVADYIGQHKFEQ